MVAFGEPAFELDGQQIDAHGLRLALADRRRQVGRLARNVGFDQRLRRRPRRDDELTPMPASRWPGTLQK